jgi:regulator of sigma E protease
MMGFLTAVISVAVILGFMILIHEFGHYLTAKLLGVRVEQFAIGFGKRLVGFRKGETDYRINALPLGGYVKMSGENPMDARTGDPREFLSHPRWHRFLIAIAGPTMNVLLAITLLTGIYMVHYEYPIYFEQPVVLAWIKQDSAAAKAGLQPGDRIVRLDGIDNPTWEQIGPRIMLSANQPLDITVQRGSQTFQKTLVPEPVTTSEVGSAGWEPNQAIVVADLEAGMPAEKAGIKDRDEIVALDGKAVPAIDALIESLQQTKDKPVDVEVLRDGHKLDFLLKPVLADDSEDRTEKPRYRIGFQGTTQMKVGNLAFVPALERSLDDNKKLSLMILELVQKLVQRKVSLRTVEGPIGIGRAAGQAASEKGWSPLLELTAAISLNLGIFNLLPIPILDGGVILLLAVEGLMGRDISLNIKERIYQAAFVFLVLFAVMVIYNDLAKTLPGMMQRLP